MSTSLEILGKKPDSEIKLGLGIFDGFHKGHRVLADSANTIMTLYPHPATVLGYENVLHLTTLEELQDLYPHVLSLKFSKQIAVLSKEAFLKALVAELNPIKIVVGYDYHFGKDRSGDIPYLNKFCKEQGILLEVVEPVGNDIPFKSSKIRSFIRSGEFDKAIQWLGHDYPLFGKVVKGDGRGASLGFPTANISVPENKLVPDKGVYTGTVSCCDFPPRPAMIYIGSKPTFNKNESIEKTDIEVFIPGFKGSLYGEELKVYIDKFVRGEQKFESKETLITQINSDLGALE